MTRTQAQKRNHDIYRLRGQLHLFKNIPNDLIGFTQNSQKIMNILLSKLEESLNNTRDNNRKYTYYCQEHIPNNPNGFVKYTRNITARCSVCGASHSGSSLFYIRKDIHATTDES